MLNPDTATSSRSIWQGLDRDQFEENADALETLKHKAAPWIHAKTNWPEENGQYLLPFPVERQLADDFAYISACEPKVVTVTAATIEVFDNPPGLTIRLAGNKGIRKNVQDALDNILQSLERCARRELSQNECSELCLDIVVRLNMNRLFKRLGSRHFEKPKHLALYAKGPISPQWKKLISKNKTPSGVQLTAEAEAFEIAFDRLEEAASEDEKTTALIDLVKLCYSFTSDGRSLWDRLEKAGYGKKTFLTRPFREINKSASYWRICLELTKLSRSYRRFFQNLTLVPIEHYQPSQLPGKEDERFIHAEVQIISYYEISDPQRWPRALGASKKACFLCYEFIRCHGCFNVSKSHGIVFSRWAVPDRIDYSPETVGRLRRTLVGVDERVQEELERARIGRVKQDDPVQSSIDLNYVPLPPPSVTTLQPGSSTSTLSRRNSRSSPQDNSYVSHAVAASSSSSITPQTNPSGVPSLYSMHNARLLKHEVNIVTTEGTQRGIGLEGRMHLNPEAGVGERGHTEWQAKSKSSQVNLAAGKRGHISLAWLSLHAHLEEPIGGSTARRSETFNKARNARPFRNGTIHVTAADDFLGPRIDLEQLALGEEVTVGQGIFTLVNAFQQPIRVKCRWNP